ncbi:hypothetical protein [Spirosoma koreense]
MINHTSRQGAITNVRSQTDSQIGPAQTDGNAPTYLSIQMRYTTQPYSAGGTSDIVLLHASLTYYRTYLENRLKERTSREQAEADEDRAQIAMINDMLFDMQQELIYADQQRAREITQ